MKIKLTRGKFALIDPEDYEVIMSYKWHYVNHGYAEAMTKGRHIYMHRLIANAPEGMEVDHINGDGLDNRQANLRICSHAENIRNAKLRKDNTSGYKGVAKNGSGWTARIDINGRTIRLGTYRTKQEAAMIRSAADIEYHKDFRRLN